MTDNQLICPTGGVQVNETKIRVVAGLVLITGLVYGTTNWLALPILLTVDFGLRSADLGKYSPLANSAGWLVQTLNLPYKATDQAPKRFAAWIGFGFGVLISGLHVVGIPTLIPTSILTAFAALESVVGFCAGCYVYTYYVRLFPKAA